MKKSMILLASMFIFPVFVYTLPAQSRTSGPKHNVSAYHMKLVNASMSARQDHKNTKHAHKGHGARPGAKGVDHE
jgi:hypothetical protein